MQAIPGQKVKIDGNIPIPTATINEALLLGVVEQQNEWQTLSDYETNGMVYPSKYPTGTRIFFRRNEYDPKLAYVAIYNWNQATSVTFDASSILAPGDSYMLHQIFNYYGDVTTGSYSAGGITVNMTGRSVAAPIGEPTPLWNNPTPEFQVFLLRKTSS